MIDADNIDSLSLEALTLDSFLRTQDQVREGSTFIKANSLKITSMQVPLGAAPVSEQLAVAWVEGEHDVMAAINELKQIP